MTEKEPHHEFLLPLAGLGLIAISFLAFSKKSKETIWKRDGGKSVISGSKVNLQVAHINHSRANKLYDHPSNGRLLTLWEHLLDHINRAGRNGLTENENNYAIHKLKETLYKLYHLDGDP